MRGRKSSVRVGGIVCLALLLGAVACVSRSQVPPSGYLDHSGRMSDGTFKGQFVASSADLRRYTKVQIADLRLFGRMKPNRIVAVDQFGSHECGNYPRTEIGAHMRECISKKHGRIQIVVPAINDLFGRDGHRIEGCEFITRYLRCWAPALQAPDANLY